MQFLRLLQPVLCGRTFRDAGHLWFCWWTSQPMGWRPIAPCRRGSTTYADAERGRGLVSRSRPKSALCGPRLQRDVAVLPRRVRLPLVLQHLQPAHEADAGLLRLNHFVDVAKLG